MRNSVDDCIVTYMKYVAEAGFVVRISCQKRFRSRDVKQTARVVFDLVPGTIKYKLNIFDTIHNHELKHEEFKNLSKIERQLTYAEQVFIVKVPSVNIEAGFVVRISCQKRFRSRDVKQKARVVFNLVPDTIKYKLNIFDTIHNHELKHEEFKNLSKIERQLTYTEQVFIVKVASVNIGDSDAQMLISKMKNRKKHVSDFSFDYLVENDELSVIFWADEISKYNYREFC
nr:protein FAR1-related sequence 5-like [Tanacetum cinerariifolium]